MTSLGSFLRLVVCAWVCLLPLSSAAQQSTGAGMADWFSSITINWSPDARNAANPDALWDALLQANPMGGSDLPGWELIGPFDGAGANSIDDPFPPEKKIDAAGYDGKDKQKLAWVRWEKDKPMPISDTITNAVFYAYKDFTLQTPRQFTFFISADDSGKFWLDGQLVCIGRDLKGRTNAVIRTVAQGNHRMLVKIHQKDGTWGFRVRWAEGDLRKLEVKLRHSVCTKFPKDPASLKHAERIAVLCGDMGDISNARVWLQYVLANGKDPAVLKGVLDDLVHDASAGKSGIIYDELKVAYGKSNNKDIRQLIADAFLRYAARCDDKTAAVEFIKVYRITVPVDQAKDILWMSVKAGDAEQIKYWVAAVLTQDRDPGSVAAFYKDLGKKIGGSTAGPVAEGAARAYAAIAEPGPKGSLAGQMFDLLTGKEEPLAAARFLALARCPASNEQAQRIFAGFRRKGLEPGKDALEWIRYSLPQMRNDYEVDALVSSVKNAAEWGGAGAQLVMEEFIEAIKGTGDVKQKKILCDRWVDLALSRGEVDKVADFIQQNEKILRPDLDLQIAIWNVKMRAAEGDGKGAMLDLEKAAGVKKGFKGGGEYNNLNNWLQQCQREQMPMNFEQHRDGFLKSFDKPGDNAGNRKIHELMQKGDWFLRDKDDPFLYEGAKHVIRANSEKHRESYGKYLEADLRTKVDRKELSNAAAAEMARLFSIDPAQTGTFAVKAGSGLIKSQTPDASASTFRPILRIDPGLIDLQGMETMILCGGCSPVTFSVPSYDEQNAYVQNSGGIANLRDGKIAWFQAVPGGRMWGENDSPYYPGGDISPAVCREVVVGRFSGRNGPVLVGFNRQDGTMRWNLRPNAVRLASDPVPWGASKICVLGVHRHNNGESVIIVIDVEAGQELFRLGLGRCQSVVRAADNRFFHPEWNMPAPAVAGDFAFVSTGAGAMAAVDLADRAVRWLRGYPRDTTPRTYGYKKAVSPIVGQKTVLFAPADLACLTLLDASDGKIVARRTGVDWREVRPCGIGGAVAVTPTGLIFLSLESLAVTAKVNGGFHFVQEFGDGCLVSDGRGLTAFTSKGAQAWSSPLAVQMLPVLLHQNKVYGFLKSDNGLFGYMTAEQRDDSWTMNVVKPPVASEADEGIVRNFPNGSLVKTPAALVCVGNDGVKKWEQPATERGTALVSGDYAALCQAGQVVFYKLDNGRKRFMWPGMAGWGADVSVVGIVTDGKDVYAQAKRRAGGQTLFELYRIFADKQACFLGELAGEARGLVVGGGGKYIADRPTDSRVRIMNPAASARGGRPEYVESETFDTRNNDARLWCAAMPGRENELWVFDSQKRTATKCVGIKKSEIKLPGNGYLWTEGADQVDRLFVFQRRQMNADPPQTSFFDPVTGRTEILTGDAKWSVSKGVVYGVIAGTGTNAGKFAVQTFDMNRSSSDSSATAGTGDIQDPLAGQGVLQGLGTVGNSIVCGVCNPRWRSGDGRAPAFVMVKRQNGADVKVLPFPFFTSIRQILDSTAFFNGTAVDGAKFQQCLNPAGMVYQVTPKSLADKSNVDGDLSDWYDNEYIKTPRGKFAVRGNRDELYFAVEVTDPQTLKTIEAMDPENGITLDVTPGVLAGFAFDSARPDEGIQTDMEFYRFRLPKGGRHDRCQYAVAPKGDKLAVEFVLRGLGGIDRPPLGRETGPVCLGRELFGGSNGRRYFKGQMDEVKIYNRVLKTDELKKLGNLEEVNAGLVRSWDFDEKAGETANDSAGATEGKIRKAQWADGRKGGCLSFDGKEGFVECQRCDVGKEFTVSAWVFLDKEGDLPEMFLLSHGEGSESFSLAIFGGKLRCWLGRYSVETSKPLARGQWINVAAVCDGSTLKICGDNVSGFETENVSTAVWNDRLYAQFGRFAFRFLCSKPGIDTVVNLLGQDTRGPLSYTRVTFQQSE